MRRIGDGFVLRVRDAATDAVSRPEQIFMVGELLGDGIDECAGIGFGVDIAG